MVSLWIICGINVFLREKAGFLADRAGFLLAKGSTLHVDSRLNQFLLQPKGQVSGRIGNIALDDEFFSSGRQAAVQYPLPTIGNPVKISTVFGIVLGN